MKVWLMVLLDWRLQESSVVTWRVGGGWLLVLGNVLWEECGCHLAGGIDLTFFFLAPLTG